jgi:putative hydrolase of the HAD superfamily
MAELVDPRHYDAVGSVILFDFFGTLVDAPAQLASVPFPESHRYLTSLGVELSYDEYFARWSATSERFDRSARVEHLEYSMVQLATSFLGECLHEEAAAREADCFVDVFLAEWDTAVKEIEGVVGVIESLAQSFRLAVVSNTNDRRLVPSRLDRMGVTGHFEVVLLSVEHGHRKPHPSIYRSALDTLRVAACDAVFVGDSLEADYLGPRAVGIDAWLIDPAGAYDIDPARRISSVLELPERLAGDRV